MGISGRDGFFLVLWTRAISGRRSATSSATQLVACAHTECPEEYPWSSAAAHCGLVTDPLLTPLPAENMIAPAGWSGWLDGDDGDELLMLRAATLSGRPCGSPDFVDNLSTVMGRSLHEKPRGRPRKNETSFVE